MGRSENLKIIPDCKKTKINSKNSHSSGENIFKETTAQIQTITFFEMQVVKYPDMIESKRPNKFPECKNCPIASREILIAQNERNVKKQVIYCDRINLLIFNKVIMSTVLITAGKALFEETKLDMEKFKRLSDVTKDCPGLKAQKTVRNPSHYR